MRRCSGTVEISRERLKSDADYRLHLCEELERHPDMARDGVWEVLSCDENQLTRRKVAISDTVDPLILEKMAVSEKEEYVLRRLAENRRLTARAMMELADQNIPSINISLVYNSACPDEVLRRIVENGNCTDVLLHKVASRGNVSADTLLVIFNSLADHITDMVSRTWRCTSIYSAIAEHPNASSELLWKLAEVNFETVSQSIIANPNVPEELLLLLSFSKQESIRNSAVKRIESK